MSDPTGAGEELSKPKASIVKTTLLVLPAQVVFRVGEAIFPLLLAYWFGRSHATDVYYFAWAVFAFAGSLVFSAYQDSALVPILAEERLARAKDLPRLLGSLLAHTWAIGGAIAAAVGAVAMGWFAVRYQGPDLALAAKMVVPFSIYLVAISTRTFFATLLAVEHHFMVQPIASSIGMTANIAILASGHTTLGVALVPVAALVGEVLSAAFLGWFTIRIKGVAIRPCFDRPPALRQFAKLVAAEVGGGAVTRINPVVDQLIAGLAAIAGGGTMLRYSSDVALLPTSLLQAALFPVLLLHLSNDFARRDLKAVERTVKKALLSVCGILVAATILLWLVSDPLLRFVFLRGEMDEGGVRGMVALMPYHLVGLAPFGALLVIARAHVAVKNSRIMVGMGILNAGSNAAMNVVLLRFLGLPGIALATSVVHGLVAVVFWVRFKARLRDLERGVEA